MPYLLLVIDEFGELLEVSPEFLDVLLAIGRQGRSLGVHLILSSQRLEAGRIRGLESYLSYRIALRTFTADESAAVIRVQARGFPAAAGRTRVLPRGRDLPAIQGLASLRRRRPEEIPSLS